MPTLDLDTLTLSSGSHLESDGEYCVMEATACVAGEPWSDSPQCVCPVITLFLRSWNDGLETNGDRNRLLKLFIPRIINTRGSDSLSLRRAEMTIDWLVREAVPLALDLTPTLAPRATVLRGLRPITMDTIADVVPAVRAVHEAAVDAYWGVYQDDRWYAVRDAAKNTTKSTATASALRAAFEAAQNDAWNATLDIVWDTAIDAIFVAAWDAAVRGHWDAIEGFVHNAQESATALTDRLIECND